jgi:hypothetical protein
MRKPLLGVSVALLVLSILLGLVNAAKMKTLRAEQANALAARQTAEHAGLVGHNKMENRKNPGSVRVQSANKEPQIAAIEAELAKVKTDKSNLKTQLAETQAELAQLKDRSSTTTVSLTEANSPKIAELRTQLDEARRQLENGEREKALLAEKIQRFARQASPVPKEGQPLRRPAPPPGLHGSVLAVNRAYNFVVLNLGARQGVESNAEMLVLRDRTVIGKIRVSSVELATSIGDIISNSLPRGVQVQTGDTVIYAGTGF